MKIDASLSTGVKNLRDVPAVARAAEAIGFDALWTVEAAHEALLPLVLIAEHTQRIEFGTAIAVAFARSPMTLAQASWDLAAMSGGRFILGLGSQVKAHVERRFGMVWDPPTPKLRDMLGAIRATWDCWQNGTALNFSGEYYKLTLMSPMFNPGPLETPHVPIFIAGVNTSLCRMAGEAADGLHVHPFHSREYLRAVVIPAVEEGAARAGRSRRDVELASAVITFSNDKQREEVRSQISFYASTPSYRPVLDFHGWHDTGERLAVLAKRGRWTEMAAEITDDMLDVFAVAAPRNELGERLRARYEGLLDRVALYEPFTLPEDDRPWRTLVEGVHAA
jgi:probable F420-dependent oxidoreductase